MPTGPHRVADETAVKEKDNGKIKIKPRGLNITWGNDDRYWSVTDDVAELKQVSWLEVTCSSDKVEVGKTYKVGFNVSLRPDAFGWNGKDVYVMAKIGKSGKFSSKKVSLGDKKTNEVLSIPDNCDPLTITVTRTSTSTQSDSNQNSTTPLKIYFGLYDVWNKNWKGGMNIHEAFITEIKDSSSNPSTSNA